MRATARMRRIDDKRNKALQKRLLVTCFSRWRDECHPPQPEQRIAVVPMVLRLCFTEWRAVTPRRKEEPPAPVVKPRSLRLPPRRHFKTTYMGETRSSRLRYMRPSRWRKPLSKLSPRQQQFIERQVGNNRRGPEIPPYVDFTLPRLVEPSVEWECDAVEPLRMPWVH